MGFTGLTLMLVSGAWWLGLLPDHNDSVMRERKFVAESLAITYTGMMQMDNAEHIRPLMEEIVRRTPELLTFGVRNKEGTLIVAIGDHEAQWTNREGQQSTDSQMKVPITSQHSVWGYIELHFAPIYPPGAFILLHDNIARLFMFITLGGLITFGGFVYHIMHRVLVMTSSEAIPKRIRSSLNTLAEGILILDKQQRIVLANEAFARLLARSPKDVEGYSISSLPWVPDTDHDHDPGALYPWDQSATTGTSCTGFFLKLQGKGRLLESLSVNSTPILGLDDSYRGTMVTFDSLTKSERSNRHLKHLTKRLKQSRAEIQKQNQTLEFLATHDSLTGCLNRRAFFAQMEALWTMTRRYGYPLCCVMVDIDHFKAINDTYGHNSGDQVIRHVVNMLETGKRSSDILGRYGGEEFVLLLPHVGIDEATVATERLRRSIEESVCGSIRCTASMGLSAMTPETQDASNLLHQADQALYAAKRGGRNRVICWNDVADDYSGKLDADLQKDCRGGI